MIEGIFVEGLIYGIMVLGVFISFRILDFPDLTVDGSFPLGAALMAQCILSGVNLWLALLIAFAGGVIAGVITSLIHNQLKVPNLLAGILTMTMLILGVRRNSAKATLRGRKRGILVEARATSFGRLAGRTPKASPATGMRGAAVGSSAKISSANWNQVTAGPSLTRW